MKTKRFDKKLVLNKKTIAHLDIREMNAVQGQGATLILCTPVTCGEPHTGEPVGCKTHGSNCCAIC